MKSNGKLCPLGKLVVKALADQEKTFFASKLALSYRSA